MNPNYTNGNDGSEDQNKNRAFVPMQSYGMPPGFIPPGVPVPQVPQMMPPVPSQMYPGPFVPPFIPAVPLSTSVAPTVQQMNPDTTGYFGNLSPAVSEDVLTAILTCCGGFKRLKRPVDPSTGKPKPFAFVEFEKRDELFRAFGLFQDFPLDNRHLNIKIEGTMSSIASSSIDLGEQLKIYEGISRILIGKKVTGGGSMDWLERKISKLKETREESSEDGKNQQIRRDSRQSQSQRNYSDLIEAESNEFESQFTKTASLTTSVGTAALKDRERRWEGRVKEFERDLRRDLEKDEERTRRHVKEAAELAEFVDKFSDAQRETNFFCDREKWRKIRQRAIEKETEIFEEVLRIRQEISVKTQREFIETRIPSEREEIFAFPIRWDSFGKVAEEFKEICRERTAALFPANHRELSVKLGEFVFNEICGRKTISGLAETVKMEPTFLAVSSDSDEAEILLMILWRWLIYFTHKQ